jgi:hypothetical protein
VEDPGMTSEAMSQILGVATMSMEARDMVRLRTFRWDKEV